jgi:hypothetical protein
LMRFFVSGMALVPQTGITVQPRQDFTPIEDKRS